MCMWCGQYNDVVPSNDHSERCLRNGLYSHGGNWVCSHPILWQHQPTQVPVACSIISVLQIHMYCREWMKTLLSIPDVRQNYELNKNTTKWFLSRVSTHVCKSCELWKINPPTTQCYCISSVMGKRGYPVCALLLTLVLAGPSLCSVLYVTPIALNTVVLHARPETTHT